MTDRKEAQSLEHILAQEVSYQKNVWSGVEGGKTIGGILTEIRTGTLSGVVAELRRLRYEGDLDGYRLQKLRLPSVTFCGIFGSERRTDSLLKYNRLLVIDIDGLSSEEKEQVKKSLYEEPTVLAYWESPSQEGIKALVPLDFSWEIEADSVVRAHKTAFILAAAHFKENHNIFIDKSGSDVTRLCFLSFDPQLMLKREVIPFRVEAHIADEIKKMPEARSVRRMELQASRNVLYNPMNRNNPRVREEMGRIIRYLEKRSLSITCSYDEWYRVAFAIANSFTHDVGERYFMRLSAIDRAKYSEQDCRRFLLYCYSVQSGLITFGTVVHYARQQGFRSNWQEEGVPKVVDDNPSQVSASIDGRLQATKP